MCSVCAHPTTTLNTMPLQRIPSMVFDLELEESGAGDAEGLDCECVETSEESYQLTCCTKLRTPLEHRVFGIVKYAAQAHKHNASVAKKLDVTRFVACYLTLNGLSPTLRTSVGGGQGGECLQNLRHTYLVCKEHDKEQECVVIEPNFREQFAVARPSKKYQKFYNSIPDVFVGSTQNLRVAVDLICEEIRRSFKQSRLPVPAWRKHKSLVSKWMPRRWEDCAVSLDQLREWGAPLPMVHTMGEVEAQRAAREHAIYSPTVRIGSF